MATRETVCRPHRIRMFVLIWGILLSGASVWGKQPCQKGNFCTTLSEAVITAEAGLCVVIPCSFTTRDDFKTQHIVWYYKCESSTKCVDANIIFHTNKLDNKVQSLFKGRVSLLQPDVSQGNCSIIINDLTESDSGAYQLRVNGLLNGNKDGWTYTERAVLSVKALTQKPSVMIPSLTERQQTTLTCTAPGLCSGSDPKFTWTWRGAGENDSQITGNITALKTENLTAVTQRHSSTLTFNPSAEHHNSNVICKVSFRNNITAEETVTLKVNYSKTPVITGVTTVKDGDDLNLTCSVESFPPAVFTWTKHGSNGNLPKETKTVVRNDTGTLIISNMTAEYSGLYVCTAKHQIPTLSTHAEVNVTFVKKPVITGNTTIKDGDDLNLTCSVESFPPSVITWTKHGSIRNLTKETKIILHNDTGTATLIIRNVTVDYSGLYVCKAEHQIPTLSTHAEVNVTFHPRIFSTSGCVVQSEVLTCVCISEGFPLPTIKWPLLDTHTEYSVTTNFSNHAVNLSITVTLKDHNYTTVECISRNDIGEVKENLNVTRKTFEQKPKDPIHSLFKTLNLPQLIIAFLIGLLVATSICCLGRKCQRRKQKNSEEIAETLEMISAGEAVQNDGTRDEDEGGAVAQPNDAGVPREVEYSDINFSLLKRKCPNGPEATKETTETEYAEVKRKGERQDDGGQDGEKVEGNKEEEVMLVGEKEVEQWMSAEEVEGGQDMALYSNLNEIMGKA